MYFWIEAFNMSGRQLLGNTSGQGPYVGKNFFRSARYRQLRDNGRQFPFVHHWHVIQVPENQKYQPGTGRCIRVITNNPAHWPKGEAA